MTLVKFLSLWLVALSAATGVFAQEPDAPIADNSFLIEEAYNQEPGVIQHINAFARARNGDWVYTFTEEVPIKSQKHQFSVTVPFQKVGNFTGGERGFGDVALNYRYQIVGNRQTSVAPRFSLLLPTGDASRERGAGGVGFQFNLRASVRLSRKFVAHSNAGFTVAPRAENVLGESARAIDYNLGQSLVWLAAPRLNFLVETVWNNTATVTAPGQTMRENEVLINPGVRWAHNFRNGLQIVPGVGFPFGVGASRGERGIFLYLSFEHSVGKR
jgi:hypothetical protein